jgi:DNA-binding transcriptional MocR family regulator
MEREIPLEDFNQREWVDLRRSIPPVPTGLHDAFAAALAALAAHAALDRLARTSTAGGTEEDRAIGARWLEPRFGSPIDASRLLLTNGTQSALLLLFRQLVKPGKVLLAERLSYGVLRDLARVAGINIVGVDLDSEGIVPSALEAACRKHAVGALYCNPTFHNPTTSVMPEARRFELAAIARRYGFSIVEDDPIGRLYPGLPRPIARLARDVTWFVCGLTKTIAQSMRIAYVVAPEPSLAKELIFQNERLTHWAPAPIMAALLAQMIRSGSAAQLTQAIARESIAREEIARRALERFNVVTQTGSLHVWLPLPARLTHAQIVSAAAAAGALIRPASVFAVDQQQPPEAVRLSLSSPLHRDDVRRGVEIFARVLHSILDCHEPVTPP